MPYTYLYRISENLCFLFKFYKKTFISIKDIEDSVIDYLISHNYSLNQMFEIIKDIEVEILTEISNTSTTKKLIEICNRSFNSRLVYRYNLIKKNKKKNNKQR